VPKVPNQGPWLPPARGGWSGCPGRTALFYGRTHITGLEPGRRIRLHGVVGIDDSRLTMVNPRYELR